MLLSGTEARLIAEALEAGDSLSSALSGLDGARRGEAKALLGVAGLAKDRAALVAVLRAIEGARALTQSVETLWTMPGHVAQSSGLTTSVARLIEGARTSVICSTFNFQTTSLLWHGLKDAAHRPGVSVRVYVDAHATSGDKGPRAEEIAAWLSPAVVFRTSTFDGKPVRNHAKFVAVDHRWIVVTSANFSWSAEYGNVELGVLVDDPDLTDGVEREMRAAEELLYVQAKSSGSY